ncbi:hypothetical protein GGI25_002005 [Coemansia spiralis]|uniref:F-box domain-containing protein n=2 Tax=Coemansia TaxID=4863 RepID=A0A9W8G956_9FUNG|nr:hypothetical protein BX070DRAFT_236356 [Coemansia spiralis]KAJ1992672.1 hypothetical protein EDC05_002615 [Coemansia umbellata]KAJ2623261.1 hypothetical protein GGI26_002488 [Coemansia sp. RSA 1358]KAJ2678813.1 hypothetical protein GGI25_002005 [Coemansia spiralis]
MQVSKLPSNILSRIHVYLRLEKLNRLSKWRNNLVYLAVCSEWRKALLPLAYQKLYVDCTYTPNYYKEENNKYSVFSNAALFAGATRPTLLSISMVGYGQAVVFIRKLLDYLQAIKPILTTLEELRFEVNEVPNMYHRLDKETALRSIEDIKAAAQEFAELAPNIAKFNLYPESGSGLFQIFAQETLQEHSSSISSFEGRISVLDGIKELPASIGVLKLTVSNNRKLQIPLIHASKLHHFAISRITSGFDWSVLTGGESKTIDFAQLKYLYLGKCKSFFTSIDDHADGELANIPYTVNVPKLEYLNLHLCKQGALLFSSLQLPKVIPYCQLSLRCRPIIVLHNARLNNGFADVVKKHLDFPKDQQFTYDELTNNIFSVPDLADYVTFVTSKLPSSDIEINWPQVTKLVVAGKVDPLQLVHAVSGMPRLAELAVSKLVPVSEDGNASMAIRRILDEMPWSEIESINTSMRSIQLAYRGSDWSEDAAARSIVYLMLMFRSVTSIAVPEQDFEHISKYINNLTCGSKLHAVEIIKWESYEFY